MPSCKMCGIYRVKTSFCAMFIHIARMPDETDAKKILTASSWRTGGGQWDAPILHG